MGERWFSYIRKKGENTRDFFDKKRVYYCPKDKANNKHTARKWKRKWKGFVKTQVARK
jgi:hypothetical protein